MNEIITIVHGNNSSIEQIMAEVQRIKQWDTLQMD